jgi:hypothetical protein
MKSSKRHIHLTNIFLAFFLFGIFSPEIGSQVRDVRGVQQRAFLKLIKNACVTIHDWDDMRFCFKNGWYKEKNPEGTLSDGTILRTYKESKFLDPLIFTQYGSDSLEYALVPIGYSGGGSGYFYFILLFVYKNGCALQLDSRSIMDSTGHGVYETTKIKGDTVFVYLDDYPPFINRFLFRDNKLINLARK